MPGDLTAARAPTRSSSSTPTAIADLPGHHCVADRDAATQDCALMMDTRQHAPATRPTPAPPATAAGAYATGDSNISSAAAVKERSTCTCPTSATRHTMGHRRWFLSNQLGPVGIGGTGASCHWVIGGSGTVHQALHGLATRRPVPLRAIAIPTGLRQLRRPDRGASQPRHPASSTPEAEDRAAHRATDTRLEASKRDCWVALRKSMCRSAILANQGLSRISHYYFTFLFLFSLIYKAEDNRMRLGHIGTDDKETF